MNGQAGALRLGIARALVELDHELRTQLKSEGFPTRDAREKERQCEEGPEGAAVLEALVGQPVLCGRGSSVPRPRSGPARPPPRSTDELAGAMSASSAGTNRIAGPIRYGPEPSPFVSLDPVGFQETAHEQAVNGIHRLVDANQLHRRQSSRLEHASSTRVSRTGSGRQ